jgi:ankyrin repeat protein
MQNLTNIYAHLNHGELPQTDGRWVKAEQLSQPTSSASSSLDDTIQSLSQLVLTAVSAADSSHAGECLQLIAKIESQAATLTHRTVKLTPSKTKLLEQISDTALSHLNNIHNFTNTPSKIEGVLGTWNQILHMQKQGELPENQKIRRFQEKLITFVEHSYENDPEIFAKLRKVAKTSLFTQVHSYFYIYEKYKRPINQTQSAWIKRIVSAEFPLTAPLNTKNGDTLLHWLCKKHLPDAMEVLVKICPAAIDIPNNNGKLPLDFAKKVWMPDKDLHPHLWQAFQEKNHDLEWCKAHPDWATSHPNYLVIKLLAPHFNFFSESDYCKLLQVLKPNLQGQTGIPLLLAPLSMGKIQVIKTLLDLGLSPHVEYSTYNNSKTSLLQYAIGANQAEITALLLERGTDIYAPDSNGRSAFDLMIKTQPSIQIFRLLAAKLIPSHRKLFCNSAIDANYWPEALRLLKEGVDADPQEIQLWALKAVQQGQYDCLQLLVEKGYLKQASIKLLSEMLDRAPLAWNSWFLNRMLRYGLDLNAPITASPSSFSSLEESLLERALKKRNYPLAALLISMGADPAKAGPECKGLIHYASQLKQGSSAEQTLRQLLNTRNIAHLVGDPIVSKMVGDDGARLEGDLSSESVAFFSACLEFMAETHPELATPPFIQMSRQLKDAQQLALRIEALQWIKSDEVLAEGIKQLVEELHQKIDQLEVGQALLIPAGWRSGDVGHAVLVECKRTTGNQLELNVINTGEGSDYHGTAHDLARQHVNSVRQHQLSIEQLKSQKVLRKLLEPKAVTSEQRRYFPADFYGALDTFRIAELPLTTAAVQPQKKKKAQLSGTCALRCQLAYAKNVLEEHQYKQIKALLSGYVLQLSLEQNRLLLAQQPALAKLLSLAAPHLFDQFTKQLPASSRDLQAEEQHLSQLTSFKNDLQQALPKPETQNPKIPAEGIFPTLLTKFPTFTINTLSDQPDIESTCTNPTWQSLPAIDLLQISPAKALLASLNQIADHLGDGFSPIYLNIYLATLLQLLGRQFLAPTSCPLAQAVQSLKDDPEAGARFVAMLDLFATKLLEARFHFQYVCNMADYAALHYAFIMGYELGIRIEQKRNYPAGARLQDYGCAFFLQDLQTNYLNSHVMLNAEIEADFQQIWDYALKQQNSGKPLLFDFSSQNKLGTGFSLKTYDATLDRFVYAPEFQYTQAHAKAHADWKEADAAYLRSTSSFIQQSIVPDVNLEEWRIHWFYAKGLPAHFLHVRRLACLAWMLPPHSKPTYSLCDQQPDMILFLNNTNSRTPDNKLISYPMLNYYIQPNSPLYWRVITPFIYCLPSNRGNLASTSPSGILKLVPPPGGQNAAILESSNILDRELMSIRCSVNVPHISPLPIPLLLDYFGGQHLDELSTFERRLFFEASLFAALRLPKAIRELPECGKELYAFFQKALRHFEDKIASNVDLSSSAETAASLLNQWTRALVYLEKNGGMDIQGQSIETLLEDARDKIRELSQDPKFQTEEALNILLLSLMDSYHGSGPVAGLVYDLITTLVKVGSMKGSKNFPAFVQNTATIFIENKALIENSLNHPGLAKTTLDDVAKLYNIQIPSDAIWKKRQFPFYHCKTIQGLVEVNVMTGTVWINNLPLITLTSAVCQASSSYLELFGNDPLKITDQRIHTKETISLGAKDQFGAIGIFVSRKGVTTSIEQIQRQLNGRWYAYIPNINKNLVLFHPQFAGSAQLNQWRSIKDPIHYLYVHPQTMQPVIRLEADGSFTLFKEEGTQQWEWVQMPPEMANLSTLDPDVFLLQAKSTQTPRPMLMQFPHLKDENGNLLEFERRWSTDKKELRWVLRNRPHLSLAKEQRLPGVRNFHNFLILENANGARSALIPVKAKEQLDAKKAVETACVHVQIKDDALTSLEPKTNAYLAYVALTHAVTPKEYQQALAFLKKARKFEKYDSEELRLLGLIFTSHKLTNDYTGPATAINLFTHWLVNENYHRNPSIGLAVPMEADRIRLTADSPAVHWQLFWENKLPQDRIWIDEARQRYFTLQAHLPYGMRLQDNITPQELMEWGLPIPSVSSTGSVPTSTEGSSAAPLPVNVKLEEVESLRIAYSALDLSERALPIPSRPRRNTLQLRLNDLLKAARSADPDQRRIAKEQWEAMRFDPDTQTFSLILAAALEEKENSLAKDVMNVYDSVFQFSADADQKAAFQKRLQACLQAFAPSILPLQKKPAPAPQAAPVELLPPMEPITLPEKPLEQVPLPYTSSHTSMDIPRFTRLFKQAFTSLPGKKGEKPEPFTLETEDAWLQKSIQEFNADYQAGAAKNQALPRYGLKQGVRVYKLLKIHYKAIQDQAAHYSSKVLKAQEDALIDLLKQGPANKSAALKHAAEIASGRKKALDIRDCLGLFLQSDLEVYRRATHLQSEQEIAAFHNQIGDYILYHNKVNQYREVLQAFAQLDKVYNATHTPEQLNSALQSLAEALYSGTDYASRLKELDSNSSTAVPPYNPAVLLVFEYKLNLSLKDHQVEGLRDMTQAVDTQKTSFRSVMLQRIQAAGKSLVFNHIMALLKADGYHLSVHVPSTPEYKTALYDMRERSEKLFGQREHTLVFDDEPLKFTPLYLNFMLQMLKESIVRRDYVTMTHETLRALRCKYLKTRFEIQNAPPEADVSALENSNQLLKQILHLLRNRSIFTFDEMQEAFDPFKELNMPYGKPEKPRVEESQLLAEILRYACLAANDKGEFLLDVQHSSNQTSAQAAAMKSSIADKLCQKPLWNIPGIKAYLEGHIADVPPELEKPEQQPLMRLVILARQMLAGNWLQERLSLNVDEHHGLPQKEVTDGSPRLSIPYIANMKPAYGSEFSDRYVMTSNTLIAYMANGLNAQQTKMLMEACRQKALAEKAELQEHKPACTIKDTPIYLSFTKATGLDLYSIDLENAEQVHNVQQVLLEQVQQKRNPEALQLLSDYVIENEIDLAELYEKQVCSNGQNEASMCQSFVAYSASMENPNMAPVGCITKPEKGTNGQTIDLLIQQKTELHLVEDQPASLFTLMKQCALSQRLHALIDVGAFFRGKSNREAARMICEYLRETKSEIQGVLYFDDASDKLCFMQRDPPNSVKTLSGTTTEVIEAETGFSKAQLFTYYDQDHVTGIDISQDEQAAALVTMSRHTKIPKFLQGVRRMRRLDGSQRVLVALSRSAVPQFESVLHKTYAKEQAPTIRDALFFIHLKEAMGQKAENLLYALQKMENFVQKVCLDQLYEMNNPAQERKWFSLVSDLFEKNAAIDLVKEYAHKRKPEKMAAYLRSIKKTLFDILARAASPLNCQNGRKKIEETIFNPEVLSGIESEIEVYAGFSPDQKQHAFAVQNRETSRLHFRQNATVHVGVLQHTLLNKYLNQVESKRAARGAAKNELECSKEFFFSETFAAPSSINLFETQPVCWTLNSALNVGNSSSHTQNSFDEGFLTTINAAMTRQNAIDLLGPDRKKPWPVLVICDEAADGTKMWKVVLCSIGESLTFYDFLNSKEVKCAKGRTMWLVRGNGKPLAGPSKLNIDSDPKLARLMTQALFFAGEFETLGHAPWKERLESWFSTLQAQERLEWVHYFETEILMGDPPGYKASPLHRFFRKQFDH